MRNVEIQQGNGGYMLRFHPVQAPGANEDGSLARYSMASNRTHSRGHVLLITGTNISPSTKHQKHEQQGNNVARKWFQIWHLPVGTHCPVTGANVSTARLASGTKQRMPAGHIPTPVSSPRVQGREGSASPTGSEPARRSTPPSAA